MTRRLLLIFFALLPGVGECAAVTKPHVITFGKWTAAKYPKRHRQKLIDLKVRALFVDTGSRSTPPGLRMKLTDRLFACDVLFA